MRFYQRIAAEGLLQLPNQGGIHVIGDSSRFQVKPLPIGMRIALVSRCIANGGNIMHRTWRKFAPFSSS